MKQIDEYEKSRVELTHRIELLNKKILELEIEMKQNELFIKQVKLMLMPVVSQKDMVELKKLLDNIGGGND